MKRNEKRIIRRKIKKLCISFLIIFTVSVLGFNMLKPKADDNHQQKGASYEELYTPRTLEDTGSYRLPSSIFKGYLNNPKIINKVNDGDYSLLTLVVMEMTTGYGYGSVCYTHHNYFGLCDKSGELIKFDNFNQSYNYYMTVIKNLNKETHNLRVILTRMYGKDKANRIIDRLESLRFTNEKNKF